jgi:hypothetical protein
MMRDLLEPKMVKVAAVKDTNESQHSQKEASTNGNSNDRTSLSVY